MIFATDTRAHDFKDAFAKSDLCPELQHFTFLLSGVMFIEQKLRRRLPKRLLTN